MEMATLESIIVKLHKIAPIYFRNLGKTKERKKERKKERSETCFFCLEYVKP